MGEEKLATVLSSAIRDALVRGDLNLETPDGGYARFGNVNVGIDGTVPRPDVSEKRLSAILAGAIREALRRGDLDVATADGGYARFGNVNVGLGANVEQPELLIGLRTSAPICGGPELKGSLLNERSATMQRPARLIEWVVEASTFCNMRCAYCYQWDGLADQRRMPLDLWERVLRAACDYHRLQEARHAKPVSTRIIWHGGEPLALPLEYLKRTFELKEEIVATAGISPERVTSAMQTNLYAVSDAAIDVLKRHRVGFGVSFDVVRGVRLSVNGRTTEDRVLANLDRLRDAGLHCGAITVLARHTCAMICDIFDFWADRGFLVSRVAAVRRPSEPGCRALRCE